MKMTEPQEFLIHCPNYNENINNMRLNNKWCDVIIRAEGGEFHAHKNILAANLKYFESNLTQERMSEVIVDVKASELEAFIVYAYTSKISLTEVNALNYLKVAHKLDEDFIKDECINVLVEKLRAEDAFQAYNFACTINCDRLKEAAKTVILRGFPESLQTPEYLDLEFANLMDLLAAVKDISDSAELQGSLFNIIVNWIMKDFGGRKDHIEELLPLIDMTKLSADCLLKCFGGEADSEDGSFKIMEDIMHNYGSRGRNQKTESDVEDLEKALIVMGKYMDNKSYIQFYNFTEKKWSPLEEITLPNDVVAYTNCVVMNDKVYYIARCSEVNYLLEFDPVTRHSTILNSLNFALGQVAICGCREFIYLCGGETEDSSRSNRVLKYDPSTKAFDELPPMGSERADAAAIFHRGRLYVVGGNDDSEKDSVLKTVEIYDPNTNEWSNSTWMLDPRTLPSLAILDEKLYVCGGMLGGMSSTTKSKTSSVEVYDLEEKIWRAADMKKPRAEFLVIAREGKLLAVGGDEAGTVEVYDPMKDDWQVDDEISKLPKIRNLGGGFITKSCLTTAAMKFFFWDRLGCFKML